MLHRLDVLWGNVEFSKLQNVYIRDRRLSEQLRNDLTTVARILNLLSKSPFCNWLEIRILKCMANVANVPEATSMLKIFEECVYCRKCSEVKRYFIKDYINPDHLTLVIAKLNANAEHIVVRELIEHCHELESVLNVPSETNTLVGSESGCLEICLVIPSYCCLHAYEVARSCFFKLRPFNIQYLQIETLPKIYTTNLTGSKEAKSLLTEISSWNNCKSLYYDKHMVKKERLYMYSYVLAFCNYFKT